MEITSWKFCRGECPGAEQQDYDDARWETVCVPHDWSIEGSFREDEAAGGSGGYLPTGIGWYRTTFAVEAPLDEAKVFLEFDGVYRCVQIWVNGHLAGRHANGYTGYLLDITPWVLAQEQNCLAVRVDNSHQPESRWYTGSGLYRHVRLIVTGLLHFRPYGLRVETPVITNALAMPLAEAVILNEAPDAMEFSLYNTILDPQGQHVTTTETLYRLRAGEEVRLLDELLRIQAPKLWSTEDPQVYTLKSSIWVDGQRVDEQVATFGVREAAFTPGEGFVLNGEPTLMKGVCLHHDGGLVGAAVPRRVLERRLSLLKEMGCNAIRTSHNPPSPEFLDLCDQMGFLVMEELYDEWMITKPKGTETRYGVSEFFQETFAQDVLFTVRRDRNHPSVVIWSAGNEVPEQSEPDGILVLAKLKELIAREDARPVTVGCDRIASQDGQAALPEFLALQDVIGYNYADRWGDRRELASEADHVADPTRCFIGTEDSAVQMIRGEYQVDREHPYCACLPDLERMWKYIVTRNHVAGTFLWAGIDYWGEAYWPCVASNFGQMDTCGFPKMGYYFYQSLWTEAPMVKLFPHWNWEGREGEPIPVVCFTNCDYVELFLNDRFLGRQSYEFPRLGMNTAFGCYDRPNRVVTTGDLHLTWQVPYEPGELRVLAYRGGILAAEDTVKTAKSPKRFQIQCEQEIFAGEEDIAHVAVDIVDKNGVIVPDASMKVQFAVGGPGVLVGVDNGNPMCHKSRRGNIIRAFHGKCLAIIRGTGEEGIIQVQIQAKRLEPAEIRIECKRRK